MTMIAAGDGTAAGAAAARREAPEGHSRSAARPAVVEAKGLSLVFQTADAPVRALDNIDLIIVGTHGRGAVAHLLMRRRSTGCPRCYP